MTAHSLPKIFCDFACQDVEADAADSRTSLSQSPASRSFSGDYDSLLPPSSTMFSGVEKHKGPAPSRLTLPTLNRFLADFTLGFADGLTVPFALTAGLSSLGQTDTVLYAGMAEICAGMLSMGIGAYLSARGDASAATARRQEDHDDTEDGRDEVSGRDEEKTPALNGEQHVEDIVDRYLAPLDLPSEVRRLVQEHVRGRPHLASTIYAQGAHAGEGETSAQSRLCSPLLSGLSVSLGYLLGGLLPLAPYFFVSRVGDGLLWSFIVCMLALFTFGFSKDFALSPACCGQPVGQFLLLPSLRRLRWRQYRKSVWEGIQMMLLGGTAALAAVLCVRLLGGA